jgi:Mg/Co/Ni transporter MgtE
VEKYLIKADATIIEALNRLNALSGKSSMTLFVVDDNGKVLGVVGGQVAWVKPSYPVVTQNGTVLNIK